MDIVDPAFYCGHLNQCSSKGYCIRFGDNKEEECRCIDGYTGDDCSIPPDTETTTKASSTGNDRNDGKKINDKKAGGAGQRAKDKHLKEDAPAAGKSTNNHKEAQPPSVVPTPTSEEKPWRRIVPLKPPRPTEPSTTSSAATTSPPVITHVVYNPRTQTNEEIHINHDKVEGPDAREPQKPEEPMENKEKNEDIGGFYGNKEVQEQAIKDFRESMFEQLKKLIKEQDHVQEIRPNIELPQPQHINEPSEGQLPGPIQPEIAGGGGNYWTGAATGGGSVLLAALTGVAGYNLWKWLKNRPKFSDTLIDLEKELPGQGDETRQDTDQVVVKKTNEDTLEDGDMGIDKRHAEHAHSNDEDPPSEHFTKNNLNPFITW